MQLTTTRTILSAAALILLVQRTRPGGLDTARCAGRRRPRRQRQSSAARYLVGAMGCNDCHTPWKLGPKGPEPDMTRALSGHPADFVMPPAAEAVGPVDVERRGDQHRVRRPVGRQLHRQPDARQGDGPRQLDRGDVHRDDEDRPARRQGPADPAADAVADDPHAHRRGPEGGLRLPAVPAADPQPRSRPGRPGRAEMTRQRASVACLALLLMVVRQQQPHLAAGSRRPSDPALPLHLAETGLFAGGGTRRHRRRQPPVLAAVSAVDRRRRQAALDPPAGRHHDRRQQPAPAGSFPSARGSGRSSALPAAGRDAVPVESVGRRMARRAATCGTRRGPMPCWHASDGVAGAWRSRPGRQHNIPSRSDCAACHGEARRPLGFNPLQLSTDRDPNAIHGEPLTPDMVTLQTLFDEGLLTGAGSPRSRQTPPRIAADDPQTRAVLGYLSGNCGACHNGDGQISAQRARRSPTPTSGRWPMPSCGRCSGSRRDGRRRARPEGTLLIDPASPESSAVLLRMSSRRPSSQMPPLGTVLQDREAIDTIRKWIAGGAGVRHGSDPVSPGLTRVYPGYSRSARAWRSALQPLLMHAFCWLVSFHDSGSIWQTGSSDAAGKSSLRQPRPRRSGQEMTAIHARWNLPRDQVVGVGGSGARTFSATPLARRESRLRSGAALLCRRRSIASATAARAPRSRRSARS